MASESILMTDVHEDLKRSVRRFAEERLKPIAAECDRERRHPTELVREAAELGFVGAMIPERYGGAGADLMSAAIINEELTAVAASVGICISGAALGTEMIEAYGTDEQKDRYLPPIASGEGTSGIAITEPNVGSNVAGIESAAERTPDGYRINGAKVFISNGSVGAFVIVLAKTDRQAGAKGISAFIVPTDTAGYSARPMPTMGWRAHDTAEVVLEDVEVPADSLLGEEGRGFYQVMRFFDQARILAAANALGFAEGAQERALAYATTREQFGSQIQEFQGIRFQIADMESKVAGARMLVYGAAAAAGQGKLTAKDSAIAKLVASEVAEEVASMAFQLHGGYAYSLEYEIERFYRDARIMKIVEGTSEIQRVIIAREVLAARAKAPA